MARITNSAGIGASVASCASRQHGVISRGQVRALGLSDDAILRWLRDRRIHRVFRSVYVLGPRKLSDRGRISAAILACGPDAVASHRSAAFLLGLAERPPVVVDAIVPGQGGRKIDGIRLHSVPLPAPSEQLLVDGIPCTTVARTVVDLAGVHGEDRMRKTVEMAATQKKLDLAAIDLLLVSRPRRRGAPCLRRVLDDWRPVAEIAKHSTVRSLFEARLLPLVAVAGLPTPKVNAPVRAATRILEVDLLWTDHRFVVEADSRRFHAIEIAFERDRRRDRELMGAGYAVLRVTWREAEQEANAVLDVIRSELDRRRP